METVASDHPQTLVQAGGKVAENIVSGLTNTPTLLLIILLNVTMIGAAAYYLMRLEELRATSIQNLVGLLHTCVADSVPLDAFTALVNGEPTPRLRRPGPTPPPP